MSIRTCKYRTTAVDMKTPILQVVVNGSTIKMPKKATLKTIY